MSSRFRRALTLTALALAVAPASAATAQDQRDEQFYYPGAFNWRFLKTYPEGARLFNAFDYGHAVLYERLYSGRGEAHEALEQEYRFLTTDLLVRPPRFAVVEELVSPAYSKIAWRAKLMFDWAHVLHRQIYDVYADERLAMAQKDSLIERLTDYYLSRGQYAFSPLPKSMDLMEGQYFSQAFRRAYPKFNGLIWAYHWLQVGLYEPFLVGGLPAEKKAGAKATIARFWSMLEDPPTRMPRMMPMASAIAPRFSERHPRAAAIFDNLHMMHDIISDVLVADTIPHGQKRAVIYAQLDELQDSTSNVMTWEEWRNMGETMGGVAVMGGPATDLLDGVHAPITPPPSMAGMEHGAMSDGRDSAPMSPMMDLHMRMMADTAIRRRVMADTAMHRLMKQLMAGMPARHREHMRRMMGHDAKPQARPRAPAPPLLRPEANDSAPHRGHEMPD